MYQIKESSIRLPSIFRTKSFTSQCRKMLDSGRSAKMKLARPKPALLPRVNISRFSFSSLEQKLLMKRYELISSAFSLKIYEMILFNISPNRPLGLLVRVGCLRAISWLSQRRIHAMRLCDWPKSTHASRLPMRLIS